MLYSTRFGLQSRGHIEWNNDCIDIIYCGQIAKVQGTPNALMPHRPLNIVINSGYNERDEILNGPG